jgi:hypothetical protein
VSALTKIFVVLNVILSIVLTAGMVVWVNRTQNFVKAQNDMKAKLAAVTADASSSRDQAALISATKTQMQAQLQAQINAKQQETDQLHQLVTDRDTQIAQLNNNLAQTTAAQKSATDALTVAQKTVDSTNQQIADLRKNDLDLEKRIAEQSFAINDWTNKYEVTNRQWRDAEEQVAQLQSDNRKYQETLHKAGITDASSVHTINGEPLVRVEGIVQSKQNIGGVPYATISVGSADQVTAGMQFKVIDPNARDPFLGYLIVDRVEPNQAIGHLTGPRINDVRIGAEVRTQL